MPSSLKLLEIKLVRHFTLITRSLRETGEISSEFV
ncbi:hypothetical protein LINPERHAP2_LOCUS35206 [Linum perenne]